MARIHHQEVHGSHRSAWLRAAVLGANDGVVSVASLVVGVAASGAAKSAVFVAGSAGLVAGALSMAAGEYVSVGSQRDAENSDRARETQELIDEPERELEELTAIYEGRGLSRPLAEQVAVELTAHDALGTHLRDELNINSDLPARPTQAALVSAAAFLTGAIGPVVTASVFSTSLRVPITILFALLFLVALGITGARLGRSESRRAAIRVFIGGGFAMAISYGIGALVGTAV
ncbi:MAG: VIT family protein [Acidimicrobiia bacterium]